jgi:hypothetical protein
LQKCWAECCGFVLRRIYFATSGLVASCVSRRKIRCKGDINQCSTAGFCVIWVCISSSSSSSVQLPCVLYSVNGLRTSVLGSALNAGGRSSQRPGWPWFWHHGLAPPQANYPAADHAACLRRVSTALHPSPSQWPSSGSCSLPSSGEHGLAFAVHFFWVRGEKSRISTTTEESHIYFIVRA